MIPNLRPRHTKKEHLGFLSLVTALPLSYRAAVLISTWMSQLIFLMCVLLFILCLLFLLFDICTSILSFHLSFLTDLLRSIRGHNHLHSKSYSSFPNVTDIRWIIDGHNRVSASALKHLMKCVIRSRSGFEDIAPHVSRDFAPSETFPLILGEKNTLQLLFFSLCWQIRLDPSA